MSHLSLSLLGPFCATLNDNPITRFESNKVRALLIYLAVESNRPHARDTLAGLLWPDYPNRSALNNLRSALANLRQAIGDHQAVPPFLLITRDTIQFNSASPHWLDVSALPNHANQPIAQIETAVSAYRGSFLEGFSLSDSPAFEEWIVGKREQFNRRFLNALQRLAAHFAANGEYNSAIAYTRQRLEIEPWDEDAQRQLMRLLTFSGQRTLALAQYEDCCRLLQRELGVDPARETVSLYESVRDETLTPPTTPDQLSLEPPAPGIPPYKGLNFFDEADTALFYGRETLTAQLVTQVQDCLSATQGKYHVLTVMGASGSGKSSIVRAGLVPVLRTFWHDAIRVITPTAHPLQALALSFTPTAVSPTTPATLINDMARNPHHLRLALARQAPDAGAPQQRLLVVDQFEELFSLCRDENERKAFIDNLLHAASAPGPLVVVIALRADFYAHCAPFENLRQALAARQYYIGAMSSAELHRAITEPAHDGAWSYAPGLVELLLHEVGEAPGALPLLSHALLETWRRRQGRSLTLAGYQASGGVAGALAQTAETMFKQMTPPEQAITHQIFVRLTELNESADDAYLPELYTRRRATLAELIPRPEDATLVQDILTQLADARLITTSHESVEVAHEALLREWTRLRDWLHENRDGLHLHRQLTTATQEWEHLAHDNSVLYRGARLAQTSAWASTQTDTLNMQERRFLAASLAEEQAQQQRELTAAQALVEAERRRAAEQTQAIHALRRRAISLTLALGALTLLFLIALWLGQLANRNAQSAQAQMRLATSRELAAAAINNLQVDPERSILLALHALETADTLEARNALHQALPELHLVRSLTHGSGGAPGVAYSPNGDLLASIGVDGTAKIWDTSSGKLRHTLNAAAGDVGYDIAFSPDGIYLAASWSSQVLVWDAASGEKLFTLRGTVMGVSTARIAFSPDGTHLAVANMDGMPKVWNLAKRTEEFSLTGHTDICDGISFSPDGRRLATGDVVGVVKIWDATTGTELFSLMAGGMVHGVAFSPNGKHVVAASDNGRLTIWETDSGRQVLSLPTRSGVYDVVYLPDGERLVSTHQDGTTMVWDAVSGQPLLTLAGHISTVVGVAASPDNVHIATGGYDSTVKLWDTSAGYELRTIAAHDGPAYGAAYRPQGSRLATASLDGTARLWEPSSGLLALSLATSDMTGGLFSIAFSVDGRQVAVGGGDGTVFIDDTATGQTMLTLTGHSDAVLGLAFSPDGTRLATGSWDGTAKVWDLTTGQEIVTFTGHKGLVFGVTFSLDGQRVFSGGDFFVREWEATTGRELRTFSGEEMDVYGVALSPDGQTLALGRQDGVVTLWNVETGTKLRQLSGHAGLILQLVFSQDGTRLATASFDKLAKVWDVPTGQEVMTLYGNNSNVFGISFSEDGRHVATAGGDGTARIYTLDMAELTELARSRVTRRLTDEECRLYLHQAECENGRSDNSLP